MSKKIKILFSFCLALLITSCTVFALGNDFTFTESWYQAVVRNSSTQRRYTTNAGASSTIQDVTTNSVNVAHLKSDTYITYPYVPSYVYTQSPQAYSVYDVGYTNILINSPLNITVAPGQSINLKAVFFVPTVNYNSSVGDPKYENVTFNVPSASRLYLSDGSNILLGSDNVTKTVQNDYVGSILLDSTASNVTGFDNDWYGTANILFITWTNDSDSDIIVKSITNTFVPASMSGTYKYIPGYFYGFVSSNNQVVELPSYVEDELAQIRNELENQSDDIKSMLQELDLMNIKLQQLVDNSNSSNSVTNNYYETVTVPSASDEERQAYIEELITKAEEKVEELNTTIDKVDSTFNEITTSTITNVDTTIKQSMDEYLTDSSFQALMEGIFSLDLVMTLLIGAFALATVGYILFGKR